MPTTTSAILDLPFASGRHIPLPGLPGLKEHPWKQDTLPAHPAATPGSKSLEKQKGLLKAGQGMDQTWQHMDGEQVAHTPVCFLFWPGGFVKAQPAESVGLSPPDLLKHFVVNFKSLVKNEAQLTTGRARPAVNPSPRQGGRSQHETDAYFSHAKGNRAPPLLPLNQRSHLGCDSRELQQEL